MQVPETYPASVYGKYFEKAFFVSGMCQMGFLCIQTFKILETRKVGYSLTSTISNKTGKFLRQGWDTHSWNLKRAANIWLMQYWVMSWRCSSCPTLRATSSPGTSCHSLTYHLPQLSPTQSLSSLQAVRWHPPWTFVCWLCLELNKVLCNDLFAYLWLPGGDEFLTGRDCILITFVSSSSVEKPLSLFLYPSALLTVAPVVISKLHICQVPWHASQTEYFYSRWVC